MAVIPATQLRAGMLIGLPGNHDVGDNPRTSIPWVSKVSSSIARSSDPTNGRWQPTGGGSLVWIRSPLAVIGND
jgi:hypothetical protein